MAKSTLRATQLIGGTVVRINPDHVVVINPEGAVSQIITTAGIYVVTETVPTLVDRFEAAQNVVP